MGARGGNRRERNGRPASGETRPEGSVTNACFASGSWELDLLFHKALLLASNRGWLGVAGEGLKFPPARWWCDSGISKCYRLAPIHFQEYGSGVTDRRTDSKAAASSHG